MFLAILRRGPQELRIAQLPQRSSPAVQGSGLDGVVHWQERRSRLRIGFQRQ
ncbi:MAG: hypothetical protein IT457_03310 [Planctomycetes bacterium]|nr:hypothetical protein [Planctomycetota bacterium]